MRKIKLKKYSDYAKLHPKVYKILHDTDDEKKFLMTHCDGETDVKFYNLILIW